MCFALLLILCLITASSSQSTGTVRLYRNGVADTNQSWSSGIVQIYYSYSWGNICDDSSFGFDEADVICHQLGYSGASSYSNTETTTIWGTDYSSTKLNDVSCSSSSYLTITQCSFSTSISSSCSNRNDTTVSCYSTRIWSSPTTGDIRLTGGTYSNQGLLEVYCGQWGTVCDDYFDSTQARVACRQLGYNDYIYDEYDHLSITSNCSLPIYLHDLYGCTSSDSCLTECGGCPLHGISTSICSHSEDVTLQCGYSSWYDSSKVYSNTSHTCIYNANPTSSGSSGRGIILGTDLGSIIFVTIFIILFITMPICICAYFKIKYAAGQSTRTLPYTRMVAQPTTGDPPNIEETGTASHQESYNVTNFIGNMDMNATPPQPQPA